MKIYKFFQNVYEKPGEKIGPCFPGSILLVHIACTETLYSQTETFIKAVLLLRIQVSQFRNPSMNIIAMAMGAR
jgi:hypothetical protein